MSDDYEIDPADVDWRDTAETLQAEVNRLRAAVSIPLPPEPPRDRVVEAVDADATVKARFRWDGVFWRGVGPHKFVSLDHWHDMLGVAYYLGCTLRHVPAEDGAR